MAEWLNNWTRDRKVCRFDPRIGRTPPPPLPVVSLRVVLPVGYLSFGCRDKLKSRVLQTCIGGVEEHTPAVSTVTSYF